MNRHERRRAGSKGSGGLLAGLGRIISTEDFPVRVEEFKEMFGLEWEEIRAEAMSGRIGFAGVPVTDDGQTVGYRNIETHESEIRRWLQTEMPTPIRAKVETAGGFAALEKWRRSLWDGAKLDLENNSMTMGNGLVLKDVRMRLASPH